MRRRYPVVNKAWNSGYDLPLRSPKRPTPEVRGNRPMSPDYVVAELNHDRPIESPSG